MVKQNLVGVQELQILSALVQIALAVNIEQQDVHVHNVKRVLLANIMILPRVKEVTTNMIGDVLTVLLENIPPLQTKYPVQLVEKVRPPLVVPRVAAVVPRENTTTKIQTVNGDVLFAWLVNSLQVKLHHVCLVVEEKYSHLPQHLQQFAFGVRKDIKYLSIMNHVNNVFGENFNLIITHMQIVNTVDVENNMPVENLFAKTVIKVKNNQIIIKLERVVNIVTQANILSEQ